MKVDLNSLENFIARFLRIGVLVAGFLMFAGWMAEISFSRDTFAQFHVYRHEPLVSVLWQLVHARQWGLLMAYAGMFVLILLPVIRVVLTLFVFVKQRSYILALISGLVFFGLILSVALGIEG